jgi:pimeloyl-ACP methyl ester carboxylesterase
MCDIFIGRPPHQIYVQHWRPSDNSSPTKGSVVMIPGGGHTGVTWTTTPDGRPGWALAFAAAGWDVFVVDWPGTGRSGHHRDNVSDRATDIVDALALVLEMTGPVVLVGHSIGASLSFKLAERIPHMVRAVVAVACASVESPMEGAPLAPSDEWVTFGPDLARAIFANSDLFPIDRFDDYVSSLVPLAPNINNAALGLTDDLRVGSVAMHERPDPLPVLLLVADEDHTVPLPRARQTSEALGVQMTSVAVDWGRPGHGHLLIVEKGTDEIARRVVAWLHARLLD